MSIDTYGCSPTIPLTFDGHVIDYTDRGYYNLTGLQKSIGRIRVILKGTPEDSTDRLSPIITNSRSCTIIKDNDRYVPLFHIGLFLTQLGGKFIGRSNYHEVAQSAMPPINTSNMDSVSRLRVALGRRTNPSLRDLDLLENYYTTTDNNNINSREHQLASMLQPIFTDKAVTSVSELLTQINVGVENFCLNTILRRLGVIDTDDIITPLGKQCIDKQWLVSSNHLMFTRGGFHELKPYIITKYLLDHLLTSVSDQH